MWGSDPAEPATSLQSSQKKLEGYFWKCVQSSRPTTWKINYCRTVFFHGSSKAEFRQLPANWQLEHQFSILFPCMRLAYLCRLAGMDQYDASSPQLHALGDCRRETGRPSAFDRSSSLFCRYHRHSHARSVHHLGLVFLPGWTHQIGSTSPRPYVPLSASSSTTKTISFY